MEADADAVEALLVAQELEETEEEWRGIRGCRSPSVRYRKRALARAVSNDGRSAGAGERARARVALCLFIPASGFEAAGTKRERGIDLVNADREGGGSGPSYTLPLFLPLPSLPLPISLPKFLLLLPSSMPNCRMVRKTLLETQIENGRW